MLPDDMILGIDHVGIAVPNLQAAVDFDRTCFGMKVVHEEVGEEQATGSTGGDARGRG